MGLKFLKVLIFRKVFGEMLVFAESIEIGEDGVAFGMSWIIDLEVKRIGKHGLNLIVDGLLVIGKIDAVTKGFGHLGFAIGARKSAGSFVFRKQNLTRSQCISIERIELVDDFVALLDHRRLIFTGRNDGGIESRDIGCL